MSAARPSKAEIEALERDLYARLGLTPNATREELAAAYEAVQGYLGAAPRDLRDWAKARSAEVDEAYALLSDPAALAGAVALVGAVERPAHQPGGPATPPARRATSVSAEVAEAEDDVDVDELVASVTPDTHRDTVGAKPKATAAKTAVPVKPRRSASARRARLARRAAAGVGLVVAFVAVAYIGYNFGPGGAPATAAQQSPGTAGASAAPTIDAQKVASLMQKIQANPNDLTSLLGLVDAYMQAEDYKTAGDFAAKVVAVDPNNVQGYLAVGAAAYNQGDDATAETAWKKAVALDPKSVDGHYYLGFLYFAKQPQDTANAIAEWQKVIALDPSSDLATSLKAHLASMTGSPAPGGSAAPSGSAAPAASPSPAASPAPSSSAQP